MEQKKKVTLRQAAELLKEHGYILTMGEFEDFDSWDSYFEQHYKKRCETGNFPRECFFYTDILSIME